MTQTAGVDEISTSPEDLELTPQQRAYFDTFGFLAIRGLFAADMGRITEGFEEIFADQESPRIDTREHLHLEQRRVMVPAFVTRSDKLAWLPEDPRVRGIVRGLIGDDYEYAESDGNLFYCESSWHSDIYSAPLKQYHVKMSFYLDPLHGESGAIRMIPGTNHHRTPFATRLRRDLEDHEKIEEIFGVSHRDIPSWTIESEPGDVIVGNFRTIHASFNGGERRRLFTINFREPTDGADRG